MSASARRIPPLSGLDKVAVFAIAISVGFIAIVASSPFSRGLLAGAVVMAIYGYLSDQTDLIAIAPALPGFGLIAWWGNYGVYLLTPRTLDATLLRLDHGVGVTVFAWVTTRPAIHSALVAVYVGLGLAGGIAICSSPRRAELVRACVIAAALAPIFYFLFPAVGPRWIGQPAARDCVPSLHWTWSLLFLIYSSRRMMLPMAIFAFLTAAATMGLGEHYAIDLVAALPFTAAICVLARFPIERIWRRPFRSSETESGTGSISLTPDS